MISLVPSARSLANSATNTAIMREKAVRIPRAVWRQAAMDHQGKIQALLQPMLLPPMNRRRQPNQYESWFTSLDPKNPVCNFLIEYYGLKGLRGVKRLGRWSPNPQLLLQSIPCYHTCQELLESSTFTSFSSTAKPAGTPYVGILLEDVSEEDLATLLHLRGAILDESGGALYSPYLWMNQKSEKRDSAESHPASAYLWFRSILQRTLEAEPILHCHGLHEWAMQYQPKGQPPPPSSKYQSHLPLRVCRDIINETVERKGISCTHVDALRFFAPAAGPLNHHGASLERMDQLRLEQPACGTLICKEWTKTVRSLQYFSNNGVIDALSSCAYGLVEDYLATATVL